MRVHLKYPRERELWVYERHHLQENLDRPYISIVAISEVNILCLYGHLLSFVSHRLEDLGQTSGSHWFTVKTTKELRRRTAKVFREQQ